MDSTRDINRSVLFWALVVLVAGAAAALFMPFLTSVLWASVLAVLTWPLMKRFEGAMGRPFASFTVTLLAAVILVIPFAGLGTVVGIQVVTFVQKTMDDSPDKKNGVSLEQIASELDRTLAPAYDAVGLDKATVANYVEENRGSLAERVGRPLYTGLTKLIATILTLVIGLLTMFFLLRDGDRLLEPTLEIVPLPREETLNILSRMRATTHAVFIGVVLVSLIQAAIAGVAYWVLGVEGPLLWSLITFVFCTIPLLGAPIVYAPLAIQLIAAGKVAQGITLLGIGFLFISQVDNILRPFFIGSRARLHEMAVFFSLLGGVLLLGPIGIVAGPVVLTLLLGIVEVLRVQRRLAEEPAP
ncbi:MAG: AI-2E family transporter [Fimbriimonadaceae bacterium]